MKLCIILVCLSFITGCCFEYGDEHGSAESFDKLLGLKICPKEIVSLRNGASDFSGCFIFDFPETSRKFFESPPLSLFQHPVPLSYEKNKIFVKWKKTPFKKKHIHFFRKSLLIARTMGLEEKYVIELNALSITEDSLYSLSYENDGSNKSHNVDVFIINPKKLRFYKFTDTNRIFK